MLIKRTLWSASTHLSEKVPRHVQVICAASPRSPKRVSPFLHNPSMSNMAQTELESISNYVPDPRKTFLCEKRDQLCSICKTAKLRLDGYDDEQYQRPVLLPCGHVYCLNCIHTWLGENNTCPDCRLNLKHELCVHKAMPKEVTRDNIFRLPMTIPRGAKRPDQCGHCRDITSHNVALYTYNSLCEKLNALPEEERESFLKFMDVSIEAFVGKQPMQW